MPQTGDVVIWENWNLEIVDLDGQRIDKVLASKITEPQKQEAGNSEQTPHAE